MNLLLIFYVIKFSSLFLSCTGRNWRRIYVPMKYVYPKQVELIEGTSMTAYCGSDIQVKWTFSATNTFNQPLQEIQVHEKHVKGYNNITLVNMLEADQGYFFCHGSFGTKPFVSSIKVEVMKIPKLGGVLPSWIETTAGSMVTLHCGSVGPVKWYSEHLNSQTTSLVQNSIVIHDIKKEHSGPYLCKGSHKDKSFDAYSWIIVDGYTEIGPSEWTPEVLRFLYN